MAKRIIEDLIADKPIIFNLISNIISGDITPPFQPTLFVSEDETFIFVSEDDTFALILE